MKRVDDSARERNSKVAAQRRSGESPASLIPKGALRDAHMRWACNDPRLTDTAKIVALTLVALYPNTTLYKSRDTLVVWPNVRALAKDCGISKSAAHRMLAELVETGHLVPWTEPVPRRKRDRDDGLNGGRHSKAFAFNDPPPEILFNWKGFERLADERGDDSNLSHSRAGQIRDGHLSHHRRDKSKGYLSQIEGVFVPNSRGICPTKMKVVPENIEPPIPPTEYNLLNRDSVESDSGARKSSSAARTVNGHNTESTATSGTTKNQYREPRLPLTEHVLKVVNAELSRHEFMNYGACRGRA